MKFEQLDKKMRVFETADDTCVLPGVYIVARIDGRCFTRLTKELVQFEAPYDLRFRDMMVETMRHVMNCGFKMVYGYTQSDEMSLLFHPQEDTFGRKQRKLISVLAGEASAKLSVLLGQVASFDCRLSQLPSRELVVDYFRWRQEDAHRNALNLHCYWRLRGEGLTVTKATQCLSGLGVADKNELLFQKGINFNQLPDWQKRGVGVYWSDEIKAGVDRKSGQPVEVIRKRLMTDFELPLKQNYSQWIQRLFA